MWYYFAMGMKLLFGSNENIQETDSSDSCVVCVGGWVDTLNAIVHFNTEWKSLHSTHLRTIETYHTSCQMSGLWMYGRRNLGRLRWTSSDGGAWAWSGSSRDALKRQS